MEKFLVQSSRPKCQAASGQRSKTYGRRKLKARQPQHTLDSEHRSGVLVQLEETAEDEQNVICLRKRTIRRVLDSEDESSSERYDSSSSELPSSHDHSPASRRRKAKKKRKLDSKPLRERLFETIVKTHGRMDNKFSRDKGKPGDSQSTRSPLSFIPVPNTISPPGRRARQWTLIDPRKCTSMRSASFLTRGKKAADCVVPITEVKDMFDHVPDHQQLPDDGDLNFESCTSSQARSHHSTKHRAPEPTVRSTSRASTRHPKRQEDGSRTFYSPLTFVEIPRPGQESSTRKKTNAVTSTGASFHILEGFTHRE